MFILSIKLFNKIFTVYNCVYVYSVTTIPNMVISSDEISSQRYGNIWNALSVVSTDRVLSFISWQFGYNHQHDLNFVIILKYYFHKRSEI